MAAVIGHPVRHSRSPAAHNAAFRATGLDWVYLALDVAPGSVPAAFDGVRALGISGLSVTMPHKEAAVAAVDHLSDDARRLGAVNCVVNDDGTLTGHNTDGAGFLAALRAEVDFSPAAATCVVLGAGGAARAVVLALARAGAEEVAVLNRTASRAELAAALAGTAGIAPDPDTWTRRITAADLVVNATPIGMGTPDDENVPFDPVALRVGQVVADLVYQPSTTALVVAARRQGVTALDGRGMLVHQAALSFELWTGVDAPIEVMTNAVVASLAGS